MNIEASANVPFREAVQPGAEVILLVEDEVFVRKVAAEVLEAAGYTVVIASDAPEARKAYRKDCGTIDLLLTDVVMPGMNGHELAAEFKSLYPQGQVLLMSGYAEELGRYKSSSCGHAYLAKPFSMCKLLERVRQMLNANPGSRELPAHPTLVLR